MRTAAALMVLLLPALLLGGCEKSVHDMYQQPRYQPLQPAGIFPDGRSAQPAPLGTVDAAAAPAAPPRITQALLRRGRTEYGIYCTPCHGAAGDGDGMVAQRGFPHPPSYYEPRLLQAPDRHFYEVIGEGYGVMYPYGDRVAAPDRWAIVAYIRALQLSRAAPARQLSDADRQALEAAP